MRTLSELKNKLETYEKYHYFYNQEIGYIVWRIATGNNIEMLFIEAAEKGRGYGVELYRIFIKYVLQDGPQPYHSVFGFMLGSNTTARKFYTKMGWDLFDIPGRSIYRDDGTTIMSITWAKLLKELGCA